MKTLAALAAAATFAGLATVTASLAQDAHKGHHLEAPKAESAPQPKGMGMGMDPMKHMQEMCVHLKHMQDMCGSVSGHAKTWISAAPGFGPP